MHVRLCAFVAVLSVCFSFPLAAANPWRKLTSTHFELYSSVGDRRARAALQTLEQTMEVFAQFTRSRPVLDNRVRVVLFRDQREYNQYAPDPQTAAFYTANDLRDFVIMRQLPQDTLEVAVHEFIHLLVKHSRMQFPSWFNEGLAEVYSTYRPEGKDVVIGHVIERHMRHLAGARWLDLDLVLNLDYRVTPFKDPERKAMFYAQSWALCHMLLFDKKYTAKRGALMTQLADGKPAKQVFSELYGASTLDMLDSLRDYLGQRVLMMWKAPIHVDKSRIEAEAVDVEDMEIGLVFAELHGVMARFEQAREVYGKLTPDDWRVQFGLARLARRTGDDTAARGHYERAIALGADDGALFTDYARVLQALGGDPAEVTRSLARAAELRPGDAAIRTWYAFHLVDQNEPFQALKELDAIRKVDVENAFRLFAARAMAHLRLQQAPLARNALAQARKYAREPQDAHALERIEDYLNWVEKAGTAAPPPAPTLPAPEQRPGVTPHGAEPEHASIAGELVEVECHEGWAVFRIQAGGKRVGLKVSHPDQIAINREKIEFRCGIQEPQKARFTYSPGPDAELETAGELHEIEY